MSRCFPFPPEGYEKKPNSDVADLLKEEKHKEKKHKKKKDKEKKEGKEKKNKDGREEKHREKKDKKDKHKDKKEKSRDKKRDKETKSKDEDKKGIFKEAPAVWDPGSSSCAGESDRKVEHNKNFISSEEKGHTFPLQFQHGQEASKGTDLVREAEEAKFVQELGRRIRNEENGKGIQLVGRFRGEGNNDKRTDMAIGVKVSRSLAQDKGTNMAKSGVDYNRKTYCAAEFDKKFDRDKNFIGQETIKGKDLAGEAEDAKFVQELGRRIRNEENGKGTQLAGRFLAENNNERMGRVIGVKVSRSSSQDTGTTMDRSGVDNRKMEFVGVIKNGSGYSGTAVSFSNIPGASKFQLEGMPMAGVVKDSRNFVENKETYMEKSFDCRKMDPRAIQNESRHGGNAILPNITDASKFQLEGMPMAGVVKESRIFVENKETYMEKGFDSRKMDPIPNESRHSGNANLPNFTGLNKSMLEGMPRTLEENNNQRKGEKEKNRERGDEKLGDKSKDKDRDKKRHKKSKDREKEKKKEKSKQKIEHDKLLDISSNQISELSRDNNAGSTFDVNLKKRKLVTNGLLYDNEARPSKIPKPASHEPMQNGIKVETLRVSFNSNRLGSSELKVVNKVPRMNGTVHGQPLSIPRPKLSPPATGVGQIAETPRKSPQGDPTAETSRRTLHVDQISETLGKPPRTDQIAENLGKPHYDHIAETLGKHSYHDQIDETLGEPLEANRIAETLGKPPEANRIAETLGKPPEANRIAETLGKPPEANRIVETLRKPPEADRIAEALRKPPEADQIVEASRKPPHQSAETSKKLRHPNLVVESSKKSPHPDTKYLSQILTVPKIEELIDCDDDGNEWLFGSKKPLVRKPGVGSNVELQVWSEARHLESADIYALPYVIPY
ncbi:unnamed protein product [Cuscuta campestris]|uniref:Uncharacterized protein n=1 Tax=Cuscuta campestris TaxID=132261 RepID=A0A484NJ49_9ASTE|nr:unnamed protein product [Cuscuta campestris]